MFHGDNHLPENINCYLDQDKILFQKIPLTKKEFNYTKVTIPGKLDIPEIGKTKESSGLLLIESGPPF